MKRRWNGSVQSGNTPVWNQSGSVVPDYASYRCMVTKVVYADDPANIGKNAQNPEVLYEVVILGGYQAGQTLSNCRMAAWLGGNDNYSEVTLTPSSKKLSDARLADHDGDIVYVQFNQGHDDYPIIVGMGKGLSNTVAATQAEGPRLKQSYNGKTDEITNKGDYTMSVNGGATTNGRFAPADTTVISEVYSATDETVTRTFKSGLTLVHDGKNDKVTVTTAGGAVATLDGKSNSVSIKAGSTEILIDGASGKISLKGQMVELGSSVSDFVTQFTQLSTAFNQHVHPFTDITPGGPVPSMTQPPNAPLLSSVGSQTVKVQS